MNHSPRTPAVTIDALEPRRLLAAAPVLAESAVPLAGPAPAATTAPVFTTRRRTLVIYGTAGEDEITLTPNGSRLTTTLNGVNYSTRLSRIRRIEVWGKADDDEITIHSGVLKTALVLAGAGDDTVVGGGGNDTLRGEDGQDNLFGGDGTDRVEGGAGVDTIAGGAGADEVYGNADPDVFRSTDAASERKDFGGFGDTIF
jgi:Ca2+-binding RTX toxin-like protein